MLKLYWPVAQFNAWMSVFDLVLYLVLGCGAFVLTAGIALVLGLFEPLDVPGLFRTGPLRVGHLVTQAVLSVALLVSLDVLALGGNCPSEVVTCFLWGWTGATALIFYSVWVSMRHRSAAGSQPVAQPGP